MRFGVFLREREEVGDLANMFDRDDLYLKIFKIAGSEPYEVIVRDVDLRASGQLRGLNFGEHAANSKNMTE